MYLKNLFEALAQDKRLFIQVRVPTEENALSEGITYEVYKKAMYEAMRVDYKNLKEECRRLTEYLSTTKKIEIQTADSHVLTLDVCHRTWHRDDGTGDVPAGEVFIAPIEESAEGTILIPELMLEGTKLKGVILVFEKGRLVETSSDELMTFIKSFPGDSDIIAEFGMGLNEKVTELTGCALIDEKCRGTVHIAIGMNEMFGGRNKSPLHLDFVVTPEWVKGDGIIIMEKKELVIGER